MKSRGRFVIVLLFVVAALAGLSAFWAPRYFEAAWFLEDIAAGPESSSWKRMHRAPQTRTLHDTIDGRAVDGDLFIPDGPIKGRMVFVPGLVEDARTDPRVAAFAQSLARAGFLTLVPAIPAFRQMQASPADIGALSDAVRLLAALDLPGAPRTKVGIAALSYMAGPAILAASAPPASAETGFVFFIGGYHSMTETIRFVTTRRYRPAGGGPWIEAPPAPYALWAFLKANAQGVDDASDRATLEQIATRKLADETADIADLAAALKADGRAVFDLIENRDPERVEALIAALPPRLKAGLAALDPSAHDLSGFGGEALLVHGRDDPFIPAVESERLAAALGGKAHLYVLDQVTHVEVNDGASWSDQLDMLFAGRRLLSYRE